ncbi:MAG TPA: hypothetical protein VE093_14290, partial [Polyangiaceae bacterium]|nr:hypothetical protein [Polyangiaceae bacterium]
MKFHSGQFLTTLVLCLGAVGLSAAGCELIASVDRQKIDQGGSGGSGMGGEGGTATGGGMGGGMGGSGGMAGAGGGTGGTGGVQCMQPANCPPPTNECVMATCLNNTCGTMNVPQGMPTPTQVKGDCMLNQCTGTGEVESIDDDTDATDDMNACTTDTCQQDGSTMHTKVNAGSPCTGNGGTVCNNMGACVECVPGIAECMAPDICQNGMCNLPTC